MKVARAKEHFQLLNRQVLAFVEEAYEVSGDFNPDGPDSGWQQIFIEPTRKPSPEWGVILGDYVHNLSSALDHLAWELRRANKGAGTSRSGFPAFTNRFAFAEEPGQAMIRGLPAEARTLIERQQPYYRWERANAHPLAILKRLSNVDKHRFLHGTLAWISDPDEQTKIQLVHEGTMDADDGLLISPGQVIDHKTDLLRFHLTSISQVPPQVKVEGKLPLDIAFGKPDSPVLAHTVGALGDYVEGLLDLFEPFFDGSL